MKMCESCRYRNNTEYEKPCIVYRDDCEYYEKERGDMTREEAIKILRREIECLSHTKCEDCILEASCNPIKTTPYDSEYIEVYEIAIKALEQEPCDVAINRQAVLKTLDDMDNVLDEDRTIENYKELLKECYEVLPSVTPQEPKTGRWITQWNPAHQKEYYYCSECREEYSYDGETGIKINNYKFCPNCGCRMVEPQEQESEDKE